MTQSFGPRLPISSEVAGHALPLFAVSAKITLRGGLFYLLLAPLAFSYLFLATDLYHHARFGGLLSLVEWWILHMTILYSFGMINVFTTTYNFQGPHPKFPASRQMSKILGSALRCLRLCGAKKVSATRYLKIFSWKKILFGSYSAHLLFGVGMRADFDEEFELDRCEVSIFPLFLLLQPLSDHFAPLLIYRVFIKYCIFP